MALLTYKPALRALDSQGTPVPGAVRYIFSMASERPSTAYSDSHLTYSQPSQQKADDGGWFGRCFLPTGKYRIRIEDRFGTTLLDDDGVPVGSSVTDTLQDIQTAFDLQSDQLLSYQSMKGREEVVAGQQVRTADAALAYLVAPTDAVDHHLATAGGVKLYALPDRRGEVSTKQLGWQDGADITQALTRLLADAPADIRILRFDGSYRLRGGEYVIPDTMVELVLGRLQTPEPRRRGDPVADDDGCRPGRRRGQWPAGKPQTRVPGTIGLHRGRVASGP